MTPKIYCEVCRLSFVYRDEPVKGAAIVCSICGAELEILATEPEITARRYPREPEEEIRKRVENFARLRKYVFNEEKDFILEGLVDKYKKFEDFYCPCRFDNIPENICPCLETRMNQVRKEGHCF